MNEILSQIPYKELMEKASESNKGKLAIAFAAGAAAVVGGAYLAKRQGWLDAKEAEVDEGEES